MIVLGDTNGDGNVDVSDALITLRAAMGLIEMTPEIEAAADVNGDNRVDVSDALLILRFAMELITSF